MIWRSLGIGALAATPLVLRNYFQIGESSVNSNYVDSNFVAPVERCQRILNKYLLEHGVPGATVGVSLHGRLIWKQGFGYADVETMAPCHGDTVMRIASISKPITMTLAAKLWETGKLDLDAPIQKYLPQFPEKEWQGEKVTITTRQLVSHLGGIRHYSKPSVTTDEKKKEENEKSKKSLCEKCKQELKKSEFQQEEYYNQKQHDSVMEALKMFQNDPLIAKPGTKFNYTTHGWTLISAIVEVAGGKKFEDQMKTLIRQFGMGHTCLDENSPLIENRAKYYRRSMGNHKLENVPSVNNSYKWAGGGLLSSVTDLLQFANILLYCYQCQNPDTECCSKPTYLQSKTVQAIWDPVKGTECNWISGRGHYGMGWGVLRPSLDSWNLIENSGYVSHTGGAVGASSVLLICPFTEEGAECPPRGLAVTVLTNLQSCTGLNRLASDIANVFKENCTS